VGGPWRGEWEFGLLGPLQVRRGGVTLPTLPGKQRVVLAALLLSVGRLVTLDELADAIWGDEPPASARQTLRNYVKGLRRALSETGDCPIETRPGGYLIRVAGDELDLSRFEALWNVARQMPPGEGDRRSAPLRSVGALWRGEPLADVPSDRLRAREVPRLSEMRLQAVQARIEADLRLGYHAAVIPELRQLAGTHPLREGLHGLLMLALYQDGQRAEALAVYQHARRVLRDELGVEPGPDLRRLQRQVLAAAISGVAGAIARPAQLPADMFEFAGRAVQIGWLTGVLARAGREGPVRVAAITGAGGMGKTALAIRVAHELRGEFPDGQFFIELKGSLDQPLAAADALARMLRHLGVADAALGKDEAELAAEYRSRVADQRLLIVLDDAGDAAQVRPLLPGTASSSVLITSRSWLPGLEGCRLLELDVLADAEAWALFAGIGGAERVAAEPAATASVLAACAGLPLAVRIAASRLITRPGLDIGSLARRLADEGRRLEELKVGDLAVRAAFQVSYDALRSAPGPADDPARGFRLLGLWPGADCALAFGGPVRIDQPGLGGRVTG
jgi:DNA-binding SARP family transcriptional activator